MLSNQKLNALISFLIEKDVEITMVKQEDKDFNSKFCFNLNTHTKSSAVLALNNDGQSATIFMRYNETDTLDLNQELDDIIRELSQIVRDCMHGRNFIDQNWGEILTENGIEFESESNTF